MMGWCADFYRELILMKKKIGKLGYVFSSVMFPLIYLFAFSWGLGPRLALSDGYIPFLAKGVLGITIMLNSFQQTSLSASVSRLYFKTLQTLIVSPVSPMQVTVGLVLAGAVRGLLLGTLVYGVAWLFFGVPGLTLTAACGIVLAAFFFAALGLAVGLWVKIPDDLSLINNFLMTPMIFFGGSFFPAQHFPWFVRELAAYSPLSLLNGLLRLSTWGQEAVSKALALFLFSCLMVWLGQRKLSHYSE